MATVGLRVLLSAQIPVHPLVAVLVDSRSRQWLPLQTVSLTKMPTKMPPNLVSSLLSAEVVTLVSKDMDGPARETTRITGAIRVKPTPGMGSNSSSSSSSNSLTRA